MYERRLNRICAVDVSFQALMGLFLALEPNPTLGLK